MLDNQTRYQVIYKTKNKKNKNYNTKNKNSCLML